MHWLSQGKITSAPAPTSSNHITNKQYVDDAIAAAITPPQVFDYDVTNSTNTDTVYYINGDLLMYNTMEQASHNYTLEVYGSDLQDITGAALRARGNTLELLGGSAAAHINLTPGTPDPVTGEVTSATFKLGYSDISNLAGGQTDGYISTSVTVTTSAGEYNTGLTIRFYMDSYEQRSYRKYVPGSNSRVISITPKKTSNYEKALLYLVCSRGPLDD